MNESYTAYGLPRNPTTWSGSASSDDLSVSAGVTRQGYTWQTALGNMGLNHMNGRVQDAITGVFLSPDPYITEPGNPQNYNRYGYVYNNPMSHTDPSGFSSIPSLETVTITAYVTEPCPDCEEIIVYGRSPDWNLGGIRQQQPGSILTGDSNGYPFSGTTSTQLPKLVQATKVTDKASLVPQTQKPTMCLSDTAINATSGAVGGAVTGGTAALLKGQVELLPVLVGAGAVGGAIAGGTNSNLFSSTSGVALNVALLATGHASPGEALVGAGGEVANSYGGGPSTMVGVSMATGAASGVFIKEMYGSAVTRGAGAVLGASAGGKAALLGFLAGQTTQGLLRSYNQWRGCSP